TRDDRVEDDIDVERRAEGVADLPERLQLPNRPCQILRPGLQLAEQSRVLNGDRSLIGEGLHQRNVAVSERLDLTSVDDNGTEQLVPPKHWQCQHGPDRFGLWQRHKGVVGFPWDSVNVDGPPLESRARRAALAPERDRITLEEFSIRGRDVMSNHDPQNLPIESVNGRLPGLASPPRVL